MSLLAGRIVMLYVYNIVQKVVHLPYIITFLNSYTSHKNSNKLIQLTLSIPC